MTRRFPTRRGYNFVGLLIACIALICTLGASCGLSDSSDSAASLTSDTSASATFSALLGHMPDISETENVYVIDFARVRELYHIALPETDDAIRQYEWALTGGKIPGVDEARMAWVSGIHYPHESSSQVGNYLAFDARNADSSIVAAAENQPMAFEAIRGRYDPDATRQALARCSDECLPFTLGVHEGVELYIWGEDYSSGSLRSRGKPPLFDHAGRNVARIAVTKSHVYRTLATQNMKDMLEALSGSGRSLADDRDMELAATALDDLGVYAGSIRRNVERFSIRRHCSDMSEAECVQNSENKLGGLLDAYEILGAGFGKDEDGPFIGATLIYADEDAAKSNVAVFKGVLESGESLHVENVAWRESFTRTYVKSEGRAVIARLSVSNPYHSAWWFMIYDDAGLFYYR